MRFGGMHSGPVSKVGTNLGKRDRGHCGQGGLGVRGKVRADANRAEGARLHVRRLKARERGLDFFTNQINIG